MPFAPCRHIFTDGHQCGSPALRHQPLCYYHVAGRQALPVHKDLGRVLPALPAPDDLHAVQIGYTHLLRLIAEDEIAPRIANLLLRTLNSASANLARIHRRERTHPVTLLTDLVHDPIHGTLAPEIPAETQPLVQTSPQENEDFTDLPKNPKTVPQPPTQPQAQPIPQPEAHPAAQTSLQQNEDCTPFENLPTTETQQPATASALATQTPIQRPVQTQPQPNEDFTGLQQIPNHPPATEPPATLLRQPPQPAATPHPGPLTLGEQYVLADREHRLDPQAHRRAVQALAERLVAATPQDHARDQAILAARALNQSAPAA